MEPGRRAPRCVALVLAGAVVLPVSACSHRTPSVDRSTALPTPSQAALAPSRLLDQQVRELLAANAVGVDEDLQTGGREQEVRLTWGAHGSVVDASSLPIGARGRAGTEVFRSHARSWSGRRAAPSRAGPPEVTQPRGTTVR